jgi:uncharacterized protein YbjT (DUF2867 family)
MSPALAPIRLRRRPTSPRAGEGSLRSSKGFPGAILIRPAVMFAPDDAFPTTVARLLRILPVYPMFGGGETQLQPVYVEDVAEGIARVLAALRTGLRGTDSSTSLQTSLFADLWRSSQVMAGAALT